jgi:curved DNA-binding protein CbpA
MARQEDSAINQGSLVNYYKVLGLENYATLTEVRKAYRGLVKTTHPDVVAPELRDEATEIFKTVLLAYTVLNHPGKKQYYDEQLQSVIDAVKQRVNTHQAKAQQDGSKDAKKSAHKHGVQGKGESTQKSEENAGHKPKHKHLQKHRSHKSRPIKPPETSEPFIAVPSKPMFWKKWYTLYVVESKPNTWHATWEPNAKQRQQAAQKGVLFKCVNYYSGTVLQHVQVPFGVISDSSKACVLKLAINNSILLNLQVEKVNSNNGGWFGVGDSPKPSRPPKVPTAVEDDYDDDEFDDDYEDGIEENETQASYEEEQDAKSPQVNPSSRSNTTKPSSSTGTGTSSKQTSSEPDRTTKSHTPYKSSSSGSASTAKASNPQSNEIPLALEVWEAVLGTEKEVQLPSQGKNEAGLGSVTVPAGIQHNQQLRITHNNESYLFRVSIVIPTVLSEEARNCYEILQHLSSTE